MPAAATAVQPSHPAWLPLMASRNDRFSLSWQEAPAGGRFKRSVRPLGRESYSASTQADLWNQAMTLVAQGYAVTITPAAPLVLDTDAYCPEPAGALINITPL